MGEPLVFAKRGRVHETAVARRTVWVSRCGGYRVVRSHYTVGQRNGYADMFYAEVAGAGAGIGASGWQVISRHRKRRAAEAACQKHAKQAARLGRAGGGRGSAADSAVASVVKGAATIAESPPRQRLLFGEIEPRRQKRLP